MSFFTITTGNGLNFSEKNINGSTVPINATTATTATTITTTTDNTNTTCYIPFSKTTAGNNTALFVDDITGPLTYNPSTSTLTCTNFNGSASGVTVTDNNTNLMYPVMIQGTAGENKQLYADITTSPFSYSASTGTLTTPQLNCSALNTTGTSPTCTLWSSIVSSNVNMMNSFATGTINFGTNLTTGTINIGANAQTTGNINIGSATSTTGALNVLCDLNCSKDVIAPSFIGPATEVLTTSDNSNTTCYIPFIKTTASTNSALFVDDTTGPLTYNPSLGGLTVSILVCPRYDSSSNSANCSLFGNTTTGNIVIANSITTGSVSIASTAQTTGNINIGSTTATTGLCNIRPPLVLSRQIQTTNSATYPPNAVNHLGYTVSILGAFFSEVSLPSSTNVNLYSVSFTSANYGTYLFICNAIITPSNTTIDRQVEISISTVTTAIQAPHFAMQFIPKTVGSAPQLTLSRVIQIYADTTVYLVGYCQGSSATVQTILNNGLFSYTRIA